MTIDTSLQNEAINILVYDINQITETFGLTESIVDLNIIGSDSTIDWYDLNNTGVSSPMNEILYPNHTDSYTDEDDVIYIHYVLDDYTPYYVVAFNYDTGDVYRSVFSASDSTHLHIHIMPFE